MSHDNDRMQRDLKHLNITRETFEAFKQMQAAEKAMNSPENRVQMEIERALRGVTPEMFSAMQRELDEQERIEGLARTLPTEDQMSALDALKGAENYDAMSELNAERQQDRLASMHQAVQNDKAALIAFIKAEVKAEVTRQLQDRDSHGGD